MTQKIILEVSIYTDGDWNYDKRIIQDYTSKYFRNLLYEYTLFDDDYSSRFKRVFAYNGNVNPVKNLLCQICDSIEGRESDVKYVKEFFNHIIEELPKLSLQHAIYDSMDSNTEIDVTVRIIEDDSKEIDRIIYKE